jgi:predicted nucleotidyltransferase
MMETIIDFRREPQMKNLDYLRDQILPVLQPYGVTRVALFGSVARGEETPESDIDILVTLEEPRRKPFGLLKWGELEEELSKRLGRKVDLCFGIKPRIRPYVEKEMVVIYENRGEIFQAPEEK